MQPSSGHSAFPAAHLIKPPELLYAIPPLPRLDRSENSLYSSREGQGQYRQSQHRDPEDLFQRNSRGHETYCEEESDLRSLDDWIRKDGAIDQPAATRSRELTRTNEWTKIDDKSREFIKVKNCDDNDSMEMQQSPQIKEQSFNHASALHKPVPKLISEKIVQQHSIKQTAKFTAEVGTFSPDYGDITKATICSEQPKPTSKLYFPTFSPVIQIEDVSSCIQNFNWETEPENIPQMPIHYRFTREKRFSFQTDSKHMKKRIFDKGGQEEAEYRINPIHQRDRHSAQFQTTRPPERMTFGQSKQHHPQRNCIHVLTPPPPYPPMQQQKLYAIINDAVSPLYEHQRRQLQIQTALSKLQALSCELQTNFHKLQNVPLANLQQVNNYLLPTRKSLLTLQQHLSKSEVHFKPTHTIGFRKFADLVQRSLNILAYVMSQWPNYEAAQKELQQILKDFKSASALERLVKRQIVEAQIRRNSEINRKLGQKIIQTGGADMRCIREFTEQVQTDYRELRECLEMKGMDVEELTRAIETDKQRQIDKLKAKLEKGEFSGLYQLKIQEYLSKIA